MHKLGHAAIRLAVAMLLSGFAINSAFAHVIDRIEVNQVGDEAEIQIMFDVRIQYLREAALKNGEIHVYINLLEPDPDRSVLVPESMDSPPSGIAPHFRVSYPGLDSSLTVKFDKPVKYRVRPGNDGRSINIYVPALVAKSETVPVTVGAVSTPEQVEQEARRLMGAARAAIVKNQPAQAVEILNQLLNLPPNQQSQDAQELIGDARAKNGEYDRARVEYGLYLQLYPDARDAKAVKDKLARLPKEAYIKPVLPAEQQRIDQKMLVYGTVSQNYYNGMSHTDTTTASGLGVTTDSFSGTDQSMLITSLDITGRKRTENTDTRIVLRDDYRANFLSRTSNDNQLGSLYVETSARDRSYLLRLGRQPGTSGGVLGRFDGAWAGYSLNPTWRINGVVGSPVNYYYTPPDRGKFAGVSIDLTRLPEQWSGSGYFIEQKAGSVLEREAFGMEAHYFDTHRNYMGLLDYDRLFKAVNIAMFQGNWTTQSGNNYLMLADHRKSPSLQLSNALFGTSQSLVSVIQSGAATTDSLIADAKSLTPTSNLFMVGMTHPYTSHLRLGGDFRINNISGTGAVGVLPATPGTGNMYIYSVQAIGNNLLFENDLGVASASIINAQTYKGQSIALTQTELLRQRWRMDVSLQLYNQKDNLDARMTRITPSLRLSYRMTESVNFDAEGGIEDIHVSSPTQDQKSARKYIYVGYRWDFQ
jgi:tetratricopeptide (TPR) repeat protein